MPRDVYCELFYHIVWHTKNNAPMLTPAVLPAAHDSLLRRAIKTPSAYVHAIGGIEDHVHLAVSLPPTVELSKWAGDLKGACAHEINHGPAGPGQLLWQTGYGIVSFGKRDLEWVVRYIANQREHHARGQAHDRLERITQIEETGPEGEEADEAR